MVIHPPINLISVEELERLTALRCEEGIISLYLSARRQPPHAADRQFLFQFREGLYRFRRRTRDPIWVHAAEREKERIEDYLRWRKPVRGSLVLFSCQPARLWEIFDIDVPVPIFLDVDSTVRTWVLSDVLNQRLMDRQRDGLGAYIEGRSERVGRAWPAGPTGVANSSS